MKRPYYFTLAFALASTTSALNAGGQNDTLFADDFEASSDATAQISGTISGLRSAGLQISLNDDVETLSIAADASRFAFTTAVAVGSSFSVLIGAQPSASESCDITDNSGTVPAEGVNNVAVSCGPPATIGGTVSGLPNDASVAVTLRLNGNANTDVVILGDGDYVFTANPLPVGSTWSVSIVRQPPGFSCTISNNSDTVPVGGVSNANVVCTPDNSDTLWDNFNWNQANWE